MLTIKEIIQQKENFPTIQYPALFCWPTRKFCVIYYRFNFPYAWQMFQSACQMFFSFQVFRSFSNQLAWAAESKYYSVHVSESEYLY